MTTSLSNTTSAAKRKQGERARQASSTHSVGCSNGPLSSVPESLISHYCGSPFKGPLTCLDEIWYVVETHWKLHKITLKVVCVPSLGRKSLTSGKFVSEIRHFELWHHSSLLTYIYYIPQLTAVVRVECNSCSKAALSIKKRRAVSLCSWRVLTYLSTDASRQQMV